MLSTQRKANSSSDVRMQAIVLQSYSRALIETRLGSYLKRDVRVETGSLTIGTFVDFTNRVDSPSSLCAYLLDNRHRAALDVNQALAFSIVDLLMGGRGYPPVEMRALSPLEQNLLGNVFRAFCVDLRQAWHQMISGDWTIAQEAQFTYSLDGFVSSEKMIIARFDVEVEELAQGSILLAIPVAATLTSSRRADESRRMEADNPMDSPVSEVLYLDLEVTLPPTELTVERMLEIEPGDVLEFSDWEVSTDEEGMEVVVFVQGEPRYTGRMGVIGKKKAVEVAEIANPDHIASLNTFR